MEMIYYSAKRGSNSVKVKPEHDRSIETQTSMISPKAAATPNNFNSEDCQNDFQAGETYKNKDLENSNLCGTKENEENDDYTDIFHMSQFLITLWIHLSHLFLGPIVILLHLLMFGKTFVKNIQMWPNRFPYIQDLGYFVYIIMVLILYTVYDDIFQEYVGTIIATFTVIMLRQLMVSLKYGTISKSWWKTIRSENLKQNEFFQLLILYGWAKIHKEVIQSEKKRLLQKENRNRSMLLRCTSQIPVDIKDQINQHWEDIFPDLKFSKATEMPFFAYALLVIEHVNRTYSPKTIYSMGVLGVCYPTFTLLARFWAYGEAGFRLDAYEIVFTVISFLISLAESSRFFIYVAVGLYDFERKLKFMAQCSYVISDFASSKNVVLKSVSKLDMTDSETILSWYRMRRMFLSFGSCFTKRIFLYASCVLLMWIIVLIILILQFIGYLGTQNNFQVANQILLFMVTLLILLRISFQAVQLNFYYQIHKDLLLGIKRDIIYQLNRYKEENVKLKAAKSSLSVIITQLNQDMVVRPIKILGIKMDFQFMTKLFGAVATAVFTIVSIYIREAESK